MGLASLKLHLLHETDTDLKALELSISRAVIRLLYMFRYVKSSIVKKKSD